MLSIRMHCAECRCAECLYTETHGALRGTYYKRDSNVLSKLFVVKAPHPPQE